jgi:hypothetical protein
MMSIINSRARLPKAGLKSENPAEAANLDYEPYKMAEANCREAIKAIARILDPPTSAK